MVKYDSDLDAVFMALSHPARRTILSRLGQGSATVSELSAPLNMSLPAVTKHLKILEKAKLILRSKNAQWRPCELTTGPLDAAADWIEEQRKIWENRLDNLEAYLHTIKPKKGVSDEHQ